MGKDTLQLTQIVFDKTKEITKAIINPKDTKPEEKKDK